MSYMLHSGKYSKEIIVECFIVKDLRNGLFWHLCYSPSAKGEAFPQGQSECGTPAGLKQGLPPANLGLLLPEDTALSQDTANWLHLSVEQMVERMSCLKRSKILYSRQIFFLNFSMVPWCNKGAINLLLIWCCIKRQVVLENILSLWEFLLDTSTKN